MDRHRPGIAGDHGANLEQLQADGAGLGPRHLGACQRQTADRLDQVIGQGGQDQAELIGPPFVARGAVGEEITDSAELAIYFHPKGYEPKSMSSMVPWAPSANIHPGRVALFEPVHGSAPDIAGKGIANPIGAIRCVSLMLDHFGRSDLGERVEAAVAGSVEAGKTTPDLGGSTRRKTSASG